MDQILQDWIVKMLAKKKSYQNMHRLTKSRRQRLDIADGRNITNLIATRKKALMNPSSSKQTTQETIQEPNTSKWTFLLPVADWIFVSAASPLSLLRHTIYTVAPLQKQEHKPRESRVMWTRTRFYQSAYAMKDLDGVCQESHTVKPGPLQLHNQCQNSPRWQCSSFLRFVLAYLLV